MVQLGQRVRVEVVQIVGAFRYVVDIFQGEQVVIQTNGGIDGIFCGYPVDSAFDLSAVSRVAVAGFQVSGAMQFDDVALLVLDDFIAFYNVSAHQTNFAVRFHAEELRRRYLGKVVGINVQFAGERNRSDTGFLIFRDVWQLEGFFLVFRVVGDDHLDWVQDSYAALCGGVQLVADAVLQQTDVHDAVCFGYAWLF